MLYEILLQNYVGEFFDGLYDVLHTNILKAGCMESFENNLLVHVGTNGQRKFN